MPSRDAARVKLMAIIDTKFNKATDITFLTPDEQNMLFDHLDTVLGILSIRARTRVVQRGAAIALRQIDAWRLEVGNEGASL